MIKYEVLIEDKDGDIKKIDKMSKDKAFEVCEKYAKDYRVMINKLDEEYGTCKNIYDNKELIDTIEDMKTEMALITKILEEKNEKQRV